MKDISLNYVKRRERKVSLKLEHYPFFTSLLFLLLSLLVIMTNRIQWAKINHELGKMFNQEINYVIIFSWILIGLITYVAVMGGLGFRYQLILHTPFNLILPNLLSIVFIVLLSMMTGVHFRIRTDYFWYSTGLMSGWMYLGLVVVLMLSLVVLFVGLPRYFKSKPNSDRKWFTMHPILSMISISMSAIITLFSLIPILFVFPRNFVFWSNHLLLHSRNYIGIEWLYIMIGILTTGWAAMLLWTKRLFISSTPNKKIKRLYTVLLLLFPILILIFILIIGVLNQLLTSKGMISLIPFGIFSLIIASTLGRTTFNILDIKLPPLRKPIKKIINDSKNMRRSLLLSGVIIFSTASIYIPPLMIQPPNIDAHGVTILQNFNNTNIPFQNDIIYPSFDTQRTADEDGSRRFYKVGGSWEFKFQELGLWSGDDLSLHPRTTRVMEQMASGWETKDYIPSGWDTISVPSSFNRPDHPTEEYQDAQGICLYRRWFSLSDLGISTTHLETNNISVFLKFLGVNYITDVWLDSRYLGYHEGGFTSFAFDVTDILREEHDTSHLLAIRVDTGGYNLQNFAKLAPGFGDWFNYGGIYRDVYFEVTPRAHVIRANMQITTLTPATVIPHNG
ncbi:MAG: sugar-binding domain-containing protein, partial [Promethearchaeota archaeon]